jgi:Cytochrome C oxidase, cbb3-type, subunit III
VTRRATCAVVAALSATVLAGCGATPRSRAAGAVTALGVRPVDWNPARASVGAVRAVADTGNVVAVFGDAGATVLSAGAVVVQDPSITKWVSAGTIPGASGSAPWIVGVDGAGHLHYLRGLSAFDDVTARYGLDRPVRFAATLGPGRVGFLLDQEIAVADGRQVSRFGVGPLRQLAGGDLRAAGVEEDGLVVFDLAQQQSRAFPLRGVIGAAVGADGRVYAATSRALYATSPEGVLELVYDADGESLHGLVTSGDHVWFADGAELGVIDGDHVAETTGARVAEDASLAPSPSGDVWVLTTKGDASRFARVDAEPALAAVWQSSLAPIFARSCSSCHLPGGPSGTDLSTAEDWQSERGAIVERVVTSKTMPPEGHALSDADRAAIAGWAKRQ